MFIVLSLQKEQLKRKQASMIFNLSLFCFSKFDFYFIYLFALFNVQCFITYLLYKIFK